MKKKKTKKTEKQENNETIKPKTKIMLLNVLVVIFVLILPFISSRFYSDFVEQSDLLNFYATVLVIPSSIMLFYLSQKYEEAKKEEAIEEEIKEREPHLTIGLKKEKDCFQLTVNGCRCGVYSNIYFYDTRISDIWSEDKRIYFLRFNNESNEGNSSNIKNIVDCFANLDENGYPDFFNIYCEDVKFGARYMCYFKKDITHSEVSYYEKSVEIIDWR